VARAGDVLENPATGDRLVFRRTSADTDGEVLEYEITFRPAGFATRDHVHPRQQERHEVVEGSLGIAVDGRERRLGPGDVEVVPPNTRHRVFPLGDEPVRAVFESRPALRTEVLLETIFGLARDGKVNAKGDPGLLQLAVIFRELHEVGYPTSPPLAVQRALLTPLAAVGRLRGYRARYPSYSGGA
jgi:mannose-6-phosphate isomerase-like protein (cupin superfamily)